MEPALFSGAQWHNKRGSGHKMKHRRFLLNITKHFTVRFPRDVVDSLFLEVFESHLDAVVVSWL